MSTVVWEGEVSVPVIVKVRVEDESYDVVSVKLASPKRLHDAVLEQCETELGYVAEEEIARMRAEDEEEWDDE